ncbi:MAG: hypothetical protein ACREVR_13440, partial [Burkholderiales bacterium]
RARRRRWRPLMREEAASLNAPFAIGLRKSKGRDAFHMPEMFFSENRQLALRADVGGGTAHQRGAVLGAGAPSVCFAAQFVRC